MKNQKEKPSENKQNIFLSYDLELERVILGTLMVESQAYLTAKRYLRAEMFYNENHQEIFHAIDDLHRKNEGIDIITVTTRLLERGTLEQVGGPYEITVMSGKVASSVHLEFHCVIIMQFYIRRQMIHKLQKLLQDAMDPTIDYADLLFQMSRDANELMDESPLLNNVKDMPVLVDTIMKEATERGEKCDSGITGIPTGLNHLNRLTLGWQKGDLIVLGARPSEGKTALAIKFAMEAARANHKAVIFSLEMSGPRLTDRMMLAESGVSPINWKKGKLSPEEVIITEEAAERIRQLPINIDDTPNASIDEICYMSKALYSQKKLDLLIVDYLGLCKPSSAGRTREQEVAECSARFKALARQLNCPVIILSQLNRDSEGRPQHKPRLSDLRDSGAIEQDADLVLLLHRPARAGVPTDKETGYPTEGLGIVVVAKQRNGETGNVYFGHDPAMVKIGDYTPPGEYIERLRRETV